MTLETPSRVADARPPLAPARNAKRNDKVLSNRQRKLYHLQRMSDPLAFLFGGKTKARVLEALASNPGRRFHLRGLAQAAGTDSGNTSKLLRELVEAGLVSATNDGRSATYALDERSPLVVPLRQLVASAGALVAELRKAAAGLDVGYAGVFGSVASGTDDSASDVDVLLVGDLSSVAGQAAFRSVARKYRRAVNVLVVSPADFTRGVRAGGGFWSSVQQGRRIDLKGAWNDALS